MTERVKTIFGMAAPRRRLRGLTIIEAVFWLGGFAVLVAGVLGLYTVFTNSQREQQTRQLVANIIGAVRGLYAASTDYSDLDAEVLVNAGEIPENFVRGTDIETPWGGVITVDGTDRAWGFTIENDRTDLCIAILSDFVAGTGYHEQVLSGRAIGGTGVSLGNTAKGILASVGTVSGACSSNQNIALVFR